MLETVNSAPCEDLRRMANATRVQKKGQGMASSLSQWEDDTDIFPEKVNEE